MKNFQKWRSLCTKTTNETRRGGGALNSHKITCAKGKMLAWWLAISFAILAGVLGTILIVVTQQNKAFSAPGLTTIHYGLSINNTSYGYVTIGGTKYEPQSWGTSSSNVPSGDVVAHAYSGYRFVKWYLASATGLRDESGFTFVSHEVDTYYYYEWYEATIPTAKKDGLCYYTCYFEPGFTVTPTSADTSQGTVSGGGTVEEGKTTTITATPASGYAFVNWTDNNGAVVSTSASYTFTPTKDITLTANFVRAMVKKGDTYISNFRQYYDENSMVMKLLITPNSGEYISEISFDNSVFYAIESYEAKIYGACSKALSVTYFVTAGSNDFGLSFDFAKTDFIEIYVRTTNQAYTSLKRPSAGGVSSVAVTATLGGTVTLVGDDYESLTVSDTIICSATPCVQGYAFAGWYLSSDMTNPISTSLSVRLAKSSIYGQELIAKFEKIATSNNLNSETNNTTDFL